ncbi:MAG TPA: PhzF family phenazine biosynthesis isomerase, partial [Solirubrobacteraceae bacterium]
HPSLGTAVAVARARGERSAAYVQQTHAGLQPIEVEIEADGDAARATMLQEPASFGPQPDPATVMAAAGLTAADAHPDLPPQVVSTGQPHLMAAVSDAATLDRAQPDRATMQSMLESLGALVLYLVAVDPPAERAGARGFFVDRGAVIEDPATGSAAGPLLAYLRERAGTTALTIEQGLKMGRPSQIDCTWENDRPRVSGDVVVVADGHVRL